MTTAGVIAACARNSELRFLVIGGLAVIAYGYPRNTVDLDYLVRRCDREAWGRALAGHGYEAAHEHENFAQFTSKRGWIDLDLMFVNDLTFETMFAASALKSLGASDARFPSLEHLIALKLHVIKQNIPHRVLGDMDDVVNLLSICMKKSPEPSPPDSGLILNDRSRGVPELELPNAPDFVSRRTPLTLAQFLPLLEERRKIFPLNAAEIRARRRQPVPAEFVL